MQDMGDRVALSGETSVRDPMCRAHDPSGVRDPMCRAHDPSGVRDSMYRAHDPSGVRDEDGCRLGHCEPLWAAS